MKNEQAYLLFMFIFYAFFFLLFFGAFPLINFTTTDYTPIP